MFELYRFQDKNLHDAISTMPHGQNLNIIIISKQSQNSI